MIGVILLDLFMGVFFSPSHFKIHQLSFGALGSGIQCVRKFSL